MSGGWKTALVRKYLRLRGILEPCLLILGWEADSAEELALAQAGDAACAAPVRSRCRSARRRASRGGTAGSPAPGSGMRCWTRESASRRWRPRRTGRSWASCARRSAPRSSSHCPRPAGRRSSRATSRTPTRPARRCTSPSIVPRADDDPEGQWQQAKAAACEAISAAMTVHSGRSPHHHAVGVDHAPYLPAEIGDARRRGARRGQAHARPGRRAEPGKAGALERLAHHAAPDDRQRAGEEHRPREREAGGDRRSRTC